MTRSPLAACLLFMIPLAVRAEEPPAPEPPRVVILEEPQQPAPPPVIHQTIFAVERETLVPPEPTAPVAGHEIPGNVEVEIDGSFAPPTGSYSRYRILAARGSGGFGITSLEWKYDSSATWWDDTWPDGPTRFRADVGFGMYWWEGPKPYAPFTNPDLPARVYDLYLDLLWQERWSDTFMTDLLLQPGLFTDFKTTPPQAFRLRAHAIGLWSLAPDFQLVGGIDYINRDDIKLLPVAGVLWRPDPATRLHLVFPQPKIAKRFSLRKDKEYWAYVAAEYGGGAWTYKTLTDESHDRVEYSDYRIVGGIECIAAGESYPSAHLELGYVFGRHIRLGKEGPDFDPKDTFLLGVRFSR